ncbi:MAG: NTP transferase domain-containing protein [Candidatus Omnitrophica bacterium]|nr:NTP transferase domain-containing protein [Candidatus Omnitrophota bacterium]
MDKNTAVIILAAGKGERMKSAIPKVLHPVCSRPMLGYVLDLVKGFRVSKTVAVLGHKHEEVKNILPPGIKIVLQKGLRGTGDAVRQAEKALKGFRGTVLVLYGDTPLLKSETIRQLLTHHRQSKPAATVLTVTTDEPSGYGRIIRDKYSSISGIVEDKDADDYEKSINEINTGIICFDKEALFGALRKIRPNNAKKEYYLTDVITLLYKEGRIIEYISIKDVHEVLGINSRKDLALANGIMQKRINDRLMQQGVSIVDPDSAFIGFGTKVGVDSTIYPFTVIERDVKIGRFCSVGPFAHLREGTRLEDNTVVGNFIEIVRSRIGKRTLVKHFSYIGDTLIGKDANIGAGTVTANFNGLKKNITVIKDRAFIGSDTVLVAPVEVGRGAKTGAGSVVTSRHNVADNTVVAGVPARRLKTDGCA